MALVKMECEDVSEEATSVVPKRQRPKGIPSVLSQYCENCGEWNHFRRTTCTKCLKPLGDEPMPEYGLFSSFPEFVPPPQLAAEGHAALPFLVGPQLTEDNQVLYRLAPDEMAAFIPPDYENAVEVQYDSSQPCGLRRFQAANPFVHADDAGSAAPAPPCHWFINAGGPVFRMAFSPPVSLPPGSEAAATLQPLTVEDDEDAGNGCVPVGNWDSSLNSAKKVKGGKGPPDQNTPAGLMMDHIDHNLSYVVLAIAAHSPYAALHTVERAVSGPSLIQLWMVAGDPVREPQLRLCIAHEGGWVRHVEWVRHSAMALEDSTELRRVGLLFAVLGDGTCCLWEVPAQPFTADPAPAPVAEGASSMDVIASITFRLPPVWRTGPEHGLLTCGAMAQAWPYDLLVTGCADGRILVWHIHSDPDMSDGHHQGHGGYRLAPCSIHWATPAPVRTVTWLPTPEHHLFLTTSNDGDCLLWDRRLSHSPLAKYVPTRMPVTQVSASPLVGTVVLGGLTDGMVYKLGPQLRGAGGGTAASGTEGEGVGSGHHTRFRLNHYNTHCHCTTVCGQYAYATYKDGIVTTTPLALIHRKRQSCFGKPFKWTVDLPSPPPAAAMDRPAAAQEPSPSPEARPPSPPADDQQQEGDSMQIDVKPDVKDLVPVAAPAASQIVVSPPPVPLKGPLLVEKVIEADAEWAHKRHQQCHDYPAAAMRIRVSRDPRFFNLLEEKPAALSADGQTPLPKAKAKAKAKRGAKRPRPSMEDVLQELTLSPPDTDSAGGGGQEDEEMLSEAEEAKLREEAAKRERGEMCGRERELFCVAALDRMVYGGTLPLLAYGGRAGIVHVCVPQQM